MPIPTQSGNLLKLAVPLTQPSVAAAGFGWITRAWLVMMEYSCRQDAAYRAPGGETDSSELQNGGERRSGHNGGSGKATGAFSPR